MKKIWLSMFYSIRVGEEPDSIFLKKKIEKSEPSQDDTDQPLLLRSCAKDLTISEGTGVPFLFLFQFKSSYVFPRPFETPKNGQIPFLRNTYNIRHYKKDNGNPTVNYFIYEFHSNRNTCPTETEFVTCYPLA